MHVVAGLRDHDPARGATPRTLADRIVTARAADLVRNAAARKRDRRRARPLAAADEQVLLDGGDRSREQLELASDVAGVLAGLPPDLRWAAGLLTRLSAAEVARRTGFSRERVRGLLRRLARHFRAAGLGPESGSTPTNSAGDRVCV